MPRKQNNPALIGKAGEALVAAELLRQGISVAYPAYDGGVDLLAYLESDFDRVVPIQVKTRSETCYNFQKSWFHTDRLVLVQVWQTRTSPEFYVFSSIEQMEEALGEHCKTDSWRVQGGYSVTEPCGDDIKRMRPHRNRWERIEEQLKASRWSAIAGK
jgi:hypothetical protein